MKHSKTTDAQEVPKLKLTAAEKSELLIEGIITLIILLLLNLGIVVLLNDIIHNNPRLVAGIWIIKQGITFGPYNYHLWSWQNVFVLIMLFFDGIIIYWRMIRRYHLIQQRHVINELHYIANGHLNYRIQFKANPNLEQMIKSINALVDSTVQSMQQEREIEQSKDELITNVSHDLRTPLTSIIGYLGLINDHQYQNQDDILKYAHVAYTKAQQMNLLVNDLFEYTKMQQRNIPLQKNKFDMASMLEQITANFELDAEKKHIAIEVSCDPQPLFMEADAQKLSRVFNNLIINALKYGTGAHHIYLNARQNHNEVIIKIANDGKAIPQSALKQIFNRFYRVERSRSKATGGTGLGLAIAKSIIDRHGGCITVESNQKLTTFIIHLPLKMESKLTSKSKE